MRGSGWTSSCLDVRGWDLVWCDEDVYRRYRVKKATRSEETGEFEMLMGANSNLLKPAIDADSLIREEQWVLGYTVTPLRTIDEVFVAEILGSTASRVGHLLLGPHVSLGPTSSRDGGRFLSDAEDQLPGFDDDSLVGRGMLPGLLGVNS
ncbi:hypothetical protein RPIT_02240 [Tessaracoccus flavus]|uniref:Uncharacterized protein n=1 Tax=Tessaracoccus flavus TaxID=1610493 RepID=A0A1Q2CCD6_9ACTN|nr:hypothetical protein RPIT_02240 [Tessaracoccus flavus]